MVSVVRTSLHRGNFNYNNNRQLKKYSNFNLKYLFTTKLMLIAEEKSLTLVNHQFCFRCRERIDL